MKKFLDENFLLSTATAQKLYHEYAKARTLLSSNTHSDIAATEIERLKAEIALIEKDHPTYNRMLSDEYMYALTVTMSHLDPTDDAEEEDIEEPDDAEEEDDAEN